jgi:hypothetical protein
MGRLTRTTGERLRVNFPHVVADKDRHGNVRIYYRLKGKPKVRLWQTPGTPEFVAELEAAKVTDETAPVSPHAVLPGSLRDLCVAYFESAFKILDDSTRRVRRGILEGICQSRTKANKERGTLPYARMQPDHVEAVRDEKIDLPSAANGRVKALRQLFKWAKKTKKVSANPAAEVEYFQTGGDGWHTGRSKRSASIRSVGLSAHGRASRSTSCSTPGCVARMACASGRPWSARALTPKDSAAGNCTSPRSRTQRAG